jgi:hypothetical protein
MPKAANIDQRYSCPCCGYPTLPKLSAYEICELCNWEDDGQTDFDADEVRGGPNSDYSLTEARVNFTTFRVMYSPGRDQRITGPDSELQYETKGKLMATFDRWRHATVADRATLEQEAARLEAVLRGETERQLLEYEAQPPNYGACSGPPKASSRFAFANPAPLCPAADARR